MTFRGVVKNGVVVLAKSRRLPEGAKVSVRLLQQKERRAPSKKAPAKPGRRLMKYAGKAKGLPADAARNLDHYLYGHSKQ